MKKIVALITTLLLVGVGCAKDVVLTQENTVRVFNNILKKDTIITLSSPSGYVVSTDFKSVNDDRWILKGKNGRLEISNTEYYAGLPDPEQNPTPERQKILDEQLPKKKVVLGWLGDFYVYYFYSDNDKQTKNELEAAGKTILVQDLSQEPNNK